MGLQSCRGWNSKTPVLAPARQSSESTATTSSRLSLTLSTEATTVTRQTSNKHMSVCPSFTVSRRFLIQRELNKSQLLYMQVYLYITIIMDSIQTRSLASASGSVHGCKLGPEWRHADISSRHSSYLFCSFHNLPHTTSGATSYTPTSLIHHHHTFNQQWRLCLPWHGCQADPTIIF